ncbi:uncharacterized protein LOC135498879 isoform X2 [Lineus longissimus]|uniref:uncharacterized protein LOC135498879 isoform X2 n=1 Tax=Lineus longissimus TaxID=88925 RepID=UPI002B4E9248
MTEIGDHHDYTEDEQTPRSRSATPTERKRSESDGDHYALTSSPKFAPPRKESRDIMQDPMETDTRGRPQPRKHGEFDSATFAFDVTEYCNQFSDDSFFGDIDDDFPVEKIKNLVNDVTKCVMQYQSYSLKSQKYLVNLREQMKSVKDSIHNQVMKKSFEISAEDDYLTVEELELKAKIAQVNATLAKVTAELALAQKFSAETEHVALEASEAAIKAAQEARRIQLELERKKRAEEKAREHEIKQKRQEEERLRTEEAKRLEEKKVMEQERKAKEKRMGIEGLTMKWEHWTPHCHKIEHGEFDQGIGCFIRGNPKSLDNNDITCRKLEQINSDFQYKQNEELVSNLISLTSQCHATKFADPIYIAIPHCMSRVSGLSREPTIKAQINGEWRELATFEVTFDDYREMKFVQAELDRPANLAVVTQIKKDYLSCPRRGGKLTSNVDPRVTLNISKGTFTSKHENIMIQIQPVDSSSVADIRKRNPNCAGLLTSSPILRLRWQSDELRHPIRFTLPSPPNPVKARKLAQLKKLKEEKMKNSPRPVIDFEPEPVKKKGRAPPVKEKKSKMDPAEAIRLAMLADQKGPEEDRDEPVKKKAEITKWYMGQYAATDDDESDNLFLVTFDEKNKWCVAEDIVVNQLKMDLLEFTMHKPLQRFMVLRTKTTIDAAGARLIADYIDNYLAQRHVKFIVKQRSEEPCDVSANCVPINRFERVSRKILDDGYEDGPDPSSDISVREGDLIEVGFKGNLKNEDDTALNFIFNSQLPSGTSFFVTEVDKFLQKNYPVYRGLVQMFRKTTTVKKVEPPPPDQRKAKLTRAPQVEGDDEEEEDEEEEGPKFIVEEKLEFLCQLLINIPKENQPHSQPLQRAPLTIVNQHDPISEDYLRGLAAELGDEWKKVGHYLNVRRVRIQAILSNFKAASDTRSQAEYEHDEMKYQMLTNWVKKVPRGVDKVGQLKKAFVRVGRRDLAEDLLDMEKDFLEEKRLAIQSQRKLNRPQSGRRSLTASSVS